MQPVWRIAINSLDARRGRTLLLVLAVALATSLSAAVAGALGTLEAGLILSIGQVAGLADTHIHHRYGGRISQSVEQQARNWPEVELAAARVEVGMTFTDDRSGRSVTSLAVGVQPEVEQELWPVSIIEGRFIREPAEVILDRLSMEKLGVRVGDAVTVAGTTPPVLLTVVGVLDRPKLGVLQRPSAIVWLGTAQSVGGLSGTVDSVSLRLKPGQSVEEFENRRGTDIPTQAMFRSSGSTRARIDRTLNAANLMLLMLTLVVGLSAGFIVLTSLTTSVTQRQRELAILRCIGAGRLQIGMAQILSGLLIALSGAILGLPLGVGASYVLYLGHRDVMSGGFHPSVPGLVFAVGEALLAGVVGSAYPAFLASRVRPLSALSARAHEPSRLGLATVAVAGLFCVLFQPAVMLLELDAQTTFWVYAFAGLPMTFIGYFMLSVPVLVVVTQLLSRPLSVLPGLGGDLLKNAVLATPFRHGLTGGALMMGLAMMVSLWTGGRSVTTGWLANLKMPDAFAHSFWSLTDKQCDAIRGVPGVVSACPTTAFPVQLLSSGFGVDAFAPRNTLFISLDPTSFFSMVQAQWVQGDPVTALQRLDRGDAVLVSQEYHTAHGLGVGDRVTLSTLSGPQPFEIAGVIGSAGLDVAVQVFGIQRAYKDASISSVLGTRRDAEKHFGVKSVNLVLLKLAADADEETVLKAVRRAAPGTVVGSSRAVRDTIRTSMERALYVVSLVALGALVIACLGVGNMIVAEVSARRFELGVLRAVGAGRSTLAALVLGQTAFLAVTGCLTGAAMGLQLAAVGRLFHQRMLGIEYPLSIPWEVMGLGAVAVVLAAMLAALPTVIGLVRQPVRAMVAVTRGG